MDVTVTVAQGWHSEYGRTVPLSEPLAFVLFYPLTENGQWGSS